MVRYCGHIVSVLLLLFFNINKFTYLFIKYNVLVYVDNDKIPYELEQH